MTTKRCSDCQLSKDVDEFGRNRATADGWSVYCRECNRRRSREYYRQRRAKAGFSIRERDTSPVGYKRCAACREVKPAEAFHKTAKTTDGLVIYCRPCRSTLQREARLRREYGLTPSEIKEMSAKNGGSCAICRRRRAVHVDHDHMLGTVRGVLCFPCNVALGQMQDDIELFRNAIDYLERTTWQRTLVSTGVYQLTSPRPAAAASLTSSELQRQTS